MAISPRFLVDSVTVLLHRHGIAYPAIMNPVFRVRRDANGVLLDFQPAAEATGGDGVDECWILVPVSGAADGPALTEVVGLVPGSDRHTVVLDGGDTVHARLNR